MQLFYEPNITQQSQMNLSAENTRHIVQVLRMQIGESFLLTDGCGVKCTATISATTKKESVVTISDYQIMPLSNHQINIGIAFTKNNNRIEWLLEKITEIGVANIYPLHTIRTEQLYPKKDRLQHILISAMCQSKQYFLPILHDIITLEVLIKQDVSEQKMIAHCMEAEAKKSILEIAKKNKSSLILIGPEGDFTKDEVSLCINNNFKPVSLGNNRLRTETAGLVAITLLNNL
jgi:16S rRNA (uracil1498-N3)-methyltransferase